MKKIVINGFGRIGKIAFRLLMQNKDYEVVAINSHSTPEEIAYMLKYDSIYHSFNNLLINYNDNEIIINGSVTKIYQIDDPKKYPWKELNVDLVLECTVLLLKKKLLKNI